MKFRAPGTFEFDRFSDIGRVEPTQSGYRVDPDADGPAEPFDLPNLDFNLGSLRGNAVLRWEWRPGSTVFLAWQQSREDFHPLIGNFDFARDRTALFRARPDNIFLVKLSYWLNP